MAESNRTAVYICARTIQPQLFLNGKILRRKSFVDFNQIHVRKVEARLSQSLTCRRHWSDAHYLRLDSSVRPANNATHGFRVLSFHVFFSADNQRGGAIDNPRSVSRGYKTVFRERRSQLCQALERSLGPQVIVSLKENCCLTRLNFNRNNLLGKVSGIFRSLRFLLRA